MYDSGFRPDRSHVKSARVVGETMGNYHPHGDASIYDTLVRMAQPWSLRYPLVDGQGNFGSPGNDPPAAMRYTEARLTPLAMEMLREIDEETVDFIAELRRQDAGADVLPRRFPNLLDQRQRGIAVGMATNIPPHNLRELAEAVVWAWRTTRPTKSELLDRADGARQGPGLPHPRPDRRLATGISDAYRTGRGSIRMRGVVEIEEDAKGRTILVITELPYQVNPTTSSRRSPSRSATASSPASPTSTTRAATGSACASSSAQARRRGQGGAEQPLQAHPAADQLRRQHAVDRRRRAAHPAARPDDPPLRRPPDSTSSSGAPRYRLRKAKERAHILRGLVKALDALDEVIALIRASETVDVARARPDRAARHRRDPGPGDPRHAAAPPGRPGAPEDRRRPGQDRGRDRRPARTSSPSRSASARSCATSSPRSSRSTATTVAPGSSPPTATSPTRT